MKVLDKALAVVAWAWIAVVRVWVWVKAWGDYMYDPPPAHIKWWIAIAGALIFGGAWFGGALVAKFDRSVLGPLHTAMYGVAQPAQTPLTLLPRNSVIPSHMPDALADAPKPAQAELGSAKTDLAPLKVTTPVLRVTIPAVTPANTGSSVAERVTPPVTKVTPRKRVTKSSPSPFPG